MNHEHPPAEGRPQPKHRAETAPTPLDGEQITATDEVITDQDADAYVADIVENAPSPKAGEAIAAAYERHGTAFAVYLTLDGVDKYVRD